MDLSNARRKFHARAREKAIAVEESGRQIYMTAITRFELFSGCEQFHDPDTERLRIQRILDGYPTHELSPEAADLAGKLHGSLERQGLSPGALDSLIAAVALARSEPLITRNVAHFSRFQGLKVEPY